jgi:hypothetical protein
MSAPKTKASSKRERRYLAIEYGQKAVVHKGKEKKAIYFEVPYFGRHIGDWQHDGTDIPWPTRGERLAIDCNIGFFI